MLVDDSSTMRSALRRRLEADGSIEVVGTARDGVEALELIQRLRPDVVTLDVEMPHLDGLATLDRLMTVCPTPVVMVSGLTRAGADSTIRALELGAIDFIEKSALAPGRSDGGDLIAKVRLAALAPMPLPAIGAPRRRGPRASGDERWSDCVVVIGASTGGPRALHSVIAGLPASLEVPVVVVQHMPPGFTRSLAARLDAVGPLRVREAATGMSLAPGEVLVAPGGHHLEFGADGEVTLTCGASELGARPSVNVTMASVARLPRANPVGVILTGMGSDGTRGAALIRRAGGYVISEAQSTCVVYGMPRAVVEAGQADEVLPLGAIADGIARQVRDVALRSA
ncbi:MAG: chemotaxis response regulator protein-glutamate methylesterase [Chloroflexota bacterium]